ncbi:acetolactate synthase small subunit [Papillibacter cinnamivorans]|uniref:Acetolactate synthase small subunit n=1 Tax=Papillibacter cinnamivorans DSM 12816 TaxID=1122930 RepID=A0A1W2BIA2_9FIRM|nr:acetolactate synthase small subunit [Papillibacter cinnamivorans]SMC72637.1 acetolactate synthase, small subunit [Papillibacter cinnamivorans DSM 12816]
MEQHTLSVLVENSAGVLSQVTRLFSRKGYNIESLAVGVTDDPQVSRITIMVRGTEATIRQVANQLSKLLPVISVRKLEPEKSLTRELVLIKVRAEASPERDSIIQIANIFRANIIDVSKTSLTIEITGDEDKTLALLNLLREYGILEMARTGMVALERGQYTINDDNKEKGEYDYGKNVL